MRTAHERSRVPAAAAWLGGLGLIPFAGLALALLLLDGGLRSRAALALGAYGATILSFLGGIHWGLAIGGASPGGGRGLSRRLLRSVLPALVAWLALLLPAPVGLRTLAVAIIVMLWVDVRASRAGEAPDWYPALRWPLACAAATALLLGTFQ